MARKTDQDGLYKRGDSPYWWATYTDANGRRVRRSTGTSKQREAVALLAKWKLEAYRQRNWEEQPPRTFEELMVEYLRVASNHRSADSIRYFVRELRLSFAGREMDGLRGADIAAHITRRKADGVKNSSINRELEVLSAAINHARYHLEWDLPNPVHGRMLKEPEGRVRWISREEAVLLLEAARASRSPYLVDLIALALNTGMRREEMLGLEWSRVDFQAGLIHLDARHTKAGKRRSVPLNRAAREVLNSRERFRAEHCPASPWVFCNKNGERIRDARKGFLAACAKSGIADFCFHDLRHTCAAWLVSAGVPLTDVRDLLGHSTVSMTERYAHLSPERVRSAVDVLDEISESRFGHVQRQDGGG